MGIQKKVLNFLHDKINAKNRERLKNTTPTLICSNCAGGFIYHWLGLQFRSPFINLFLTPEDFVKALENFDEFIDTPIQEVKDSGKDYPVLPKPEKNGTSGNSVSTKTTWGLCSPIMRGGGTSC